METYIKDTIGELDHFIGACIGRRDDLAARLAAIEAGTSMHVLDAASDYQQRAAEGRPYEDAEDAETLLSEAFRQHVKWPVYQLAGGDVLMDWLSGESDPEEREAMLHWITAFCHDPLAEATRVRAFVPPSTS